MTSVNRSSSVLSGRSHDVTILQCLHLQLALMISWLGAKINPGGIFIMTGLVDTLFQSMISAYLVMSTASKEMDKPNGKKYILVFRALSIGSALFHAIYFLNHSNCFTYELRLFGRILSDMLFDLSSDRFGHEIESEAKITPEKYQPYEYSPGNGESFRDTE